MNAAEHDRVLGRLGRNAGQGQRVTDVVGHVLNGGQLVVVREQGGVALVGEAPHLRRPLLVGDHSAIAGGTVRDLCGPAAAWPAVRSVTVMAVSFDPDEVFDL